MANYSSLEELIATAENATRLLENSNYDDNSYSDTLPSTLTWNNLTLSTMFINGNSWIGYGGRDEESYNSILINRRDAKMTDLWREMGKVGGLDFLRYRWKGYANYTGYGDLCYDMIFVENGRVYLYLVDATGISVSPSENTYIYHLYDVVQSSLIGSSNLTTGSKITWYPETENDISSMTWHEGFDSFQTVRYLVKNTSDNKIYTYSSNSWVEVTANIALASTFTTYGMSKLPDNLPTEFELLKWIDTGNVGQNIEVVADLNASDADNSVVYHVQLPSANTIKDVNAVTDGTVEYSNDGSTWNSSISSISDATDFYVRIVLGTYFLSMSVKYE